LKIIKERLPKKGIQISSDDGSRFIIFTLFNPFSLNCKLLDLSFEIDKIFPAFEFSISFIFIDIFFRSNKPETMKYFDDLEREFKDKNLKTYSLDDIINELYSKE